MKSFSTKHSHPCGTPLRAAWVASVAFSSAFASGLPGNSCRPVVLRGKVVAGQSFLQPVTAGLDFKLEAVPTGWMVRVLPHAAPRPPHDYAELANPPYRSPTPLLISTDFAFRAQDAIAWNPRHFRYFLEAGQAGIAETAYRALQQGAPQSVAGAPLLAVLPQAAEATLTIEDAELAGGTADQSQAAAGVASHFAQTAHRLRNDLPPSPLGRLLAIGFEVVFPAARCGAEKIVPGNTPSSSR